MQPTHIQTMTVEQFDEWVYLPENITTNYEYIGGDIIPVVANNKSSMIAIEVAFVIKDYLRKNKLKGIVTGSDGGYIIGGERYIPDVAYTSHEKAPYALNIGYSPVPPDLVVEVISNPANSAEMNELLIKVPNYIAEGIVIWVIDSVAAQVKVYEPQQAVKIITADMTLIGGTIFPDFAVLVGDLFAE
ncbi:MAG: Uma2 family endonuclease [Phototrophicales bacterium]|nr:Uma2 family endonuclease [Phototrophicales bacterium]